MQKFPVTVSRSMYSTTILELYAGVCDTCDVKKHGTKIKKANKLIALVCKKKRVTVSKSMYSTAILHLYAYASKKTWYIN
jgi:hypothetical protein